MRFWNNFMSIFQLRDWSIFRGATLAPVGLAQPLDRFAFFILSRMRSSSSKAFYWSFDTNSLMTCLNAWSSLCCSSSSNEDMFCGIEPNSPSDILVVDPALSVISSSFLRGLKSVSTSVINPRSFALLIGSPYSYRLSGSTGTSLTCTWDWVTAVSRNLDY